MRVPDRLYKESRESAALVINEHEGKAATVPTRVRWSPSGAVKVLHGMLKMDAEVWQILKIHFTSSVWIGVYERHHKWSLVEGGQGQAILAAWKTSAGRAWSSCQRMRIGRSPVCDT